MKKLNRDYEEPNYHDVIQELEIDEFEIGQGYEERVAKKIRCKKCGNEKFVVGVDSYYTAIKCPTCKWELCIHSG